MGFMIDYSIWFINTFYKVKRLAKLALDKALVYWCMKMIHKYTKFLLVFTFGIILTFDLLLVSLFDGLDMVTGMLAWLWGRLCWSDWRLIINMKSASIALLLQVLININIAAECAWKTLLWHRQYKCVTEDTLNQTHGGSLKQSSKRGQKSTGDHGNTP